MRTTIFDLKHGSQFPRYYTLCRSLASVVYDSEKINNLNGYRLEWYICVNRTEFELITNFDEIVLLVSKVNRMVKDNSCPNNLRNRFYHKKHQFLMKAYHDKRVTRVTHDENVVGFYIGDACFHQPHSLMTKHPELAENSEYEKYTANKETLPFDKEAYKTAMIAMIFHFTAKK